MTSQTSPAHWPVITVQAEEEPIAIGFDMLAAYHGQAALAMLAVTFQAQAVALSILSPQAPARRSSISIVSGHPGPGVRDAFECVTRAVTRGVYVVDRALPHGRLVPGFDISYSFRITLDGKTIELALKPDALPPRFFELNFTPNRSEADNAELSLLKRTIAGDILSRAGQDLFVVGQPQT
ncbi:MULTISPECIES: hypothetical protein [unclassified Beijerinckia]|uniref:hypothetical protein n=1 Tax=unclassified Beijerinckia TaxID=2638183 RepID=UPI00089826DC|nr:MULTISPECIES: hypothetical protein [unclassified Beijerinckia]MDH7794587.1 hypothetical protein [Beijerinckia sp. GAS462]SEB67611.1 hypothetical protein SAMN05443249_0858 [Beijerinckia sp. 28-YEA-48]